MKVFHALNQSYSYLLQMAVSGEQTKPKRAFVLPTVESQFETAPDFAPGMSASGPWSVNAMRGDNGVSFFFSYKGKDAEVSYWSVLIGSFDFNEWKGAVTASCKLSSTSILLPVLNQKAKDAIVRTLGQVKSNQRVFKDMFLKYARANPDMVPCPIDDETELPRDPIVEMIVRQKIPAVDPKKANKDMTPFYNILAGLQADRTEKDGRMQRVITPVIINGKPLVNPTRGQLYEVIKGKRFLKHTKGVLTAFLGADKKVHLQVRSSVEALMALQSRGEVTTEEMKEMVAQTSSMFAELGVDASAADKDGSPAEVTTVAATSTAPVADIPGCDFEEI